MHGQRSLKDLVENDELTGPIAIPVKIDLPGTIQTEKWKIDRVFYYLAFTNLICLGAVAFAPRAEVRITAIVVWTGTAGLAKFLLRRAYRGR